MVGLVVRRLDSGRDEEVHQRAGGHIALLVIGNFLAHGDGERLGQATMDLAFDDHRVDAGAAIIQRIELADFGGARIDVDLHHADVGAERIGHVRRVIVADRLETRLDARDRLIVRGERDFLHRLEALRRALDHEPVDIPLDVVIMHLEEVGRDHLRLGADLPAGHGGGGAGHGGRARAIGAEAVRRGIGVAFLKGDVLGRNADLGRQDLREGRGVALTLRDGAEAGDGRACRVDANLAAVEHAEPENIAVLDRTGPDDLGEVAEANAEKRTGLAALEGFDTLGLLLAEILVTDCFQGLFPTGVVITGIIFPAESRLIRELVLLDEVLGAEFRRIHAELDGENLDHPLDEIGSLGHPERAAVRDAARSLVGVDAVDGQIGGRDIIGPGADIHEAGRELGRVGTGIESAMVGRGMAMQAGDLAVLGRRDAAHHPVVTGKGRGHQIVGTVLDPLHRNAGDDGGDDRADIARIDADLVAETATDIRRDHADVVLGDAGNQRGDGPHGVRRLEGAPDRQLAVDLVHRRHAAAGFQRARVRAVVVDHLLGDDVGFRQHRLGGLAVT